MIFVTTNSQSSTGAATSYAWPALAIVEKLTRSTFRFFTSGIVGISLNHAKVRLVLSLVLTNAFDEPIEMVPDSRMPNQLTRTYQ